MMNLARVGLIVNPHAGRGDGLPIAREAIRALAPLEVLVGDGEMGTDALRDLPLASRVFDWSAHEGKARTTWLAQQFAVQGVDALVVIGGDGTLADVAFAIVEARCHVPLLGIGVGSANVGPLITCQGADAHCLADTQLTTRAVDGLIAGANGTDLGLGFNDVVIGFTVLATVDGQVVDVDAAQKMRGVNVPHDPEPVWTEQTHVVKQSPRGETPVAQGNQVATVIVGLPDERFYGKAIAGGVLLSGLIGDSAGCLVCNHLLVRTRIDVDAYHRAEPVISRYVGLSEGERIEASGFRVGTVLCADGNPLAIMNESDRAHVRVQRGLVKAIHIEEQR
jgi:hypothetical protein